MMAFFDSLVQREIEGWSSEEVHTAPHTPSDSEVNQPTGEPDSPTDVDGTVTNSIEKIAHENEYFI